MNNTIISEGTNAFGGIIDKLGNITTEFIPYIIYIAIAILGISLTINVVKMIIKYMKQQSYKARKERREKRDEYYTRKERERYRRILLEYGKHGYDIKDEREKMGYGRYHG